MLMGIYSDVYDALDDGKFNYRGHGGDGHGDGDDSYQLRSDLTTV